jgi:Methyltransferase domain
MRLRAAVQRLPFAVSAYKLLRRARTPAPDRLTEAWSTRMDHAEPGTGRPARNTLETFFDARTTGPGIWKWRHYFEIYERHFGRFVGRAPHVLEVGIYSGGSLDMWKHYFGLGTTLYGVDIEPACKAYEDGQIQVFIGDQADPTFWRAFKRQVPLLDIVIDDGGHEAPQQITTLEAVLPHLRPGGVYLCEDISSRGNSFSAYVARLTDHLNAYDWQHDLTDPERRLTARPTTFQRAVDSIHVYPFVVVIERARTEVELVAPKHGTQWQPFLS